MLAMHMHSLIYNSCHLKLPMELYGGVVTEDPPMGDMSTSPSI
jgi:hypothetical protein